MELSSLITLLEAAKHCRVTIECLWGWVVRERAPYYYVDGNGPLFDKREIGAWVRENLVRYCPGKSLSASGEPPPPAIADLESLCVLDAGGMSPGIYFLCQGEEVVYVGRASVVFGRIASHVGERIKVFDRSRVFFLPCPESMLGELERKYILLLQPKYNKHHRGDRPYGRQRELTEEESTAWMMGDN